MLCAPPPWQTGEATLQAVFSSLSGQVGRVFANYEQSGCLETSPPTSYVTELKDGRPRAMILWVMYCLEKLAGGFKDTVLTGVLSKETGKGIGPEEDGGAPREAAPRSHGKKRKGGKGKKRKGGQDTSDEESGSEEDGVLGDLVGRLPTAAVWTAVCSVVCSFVLPRESDRRVPGARCSRTVTCM